MEAAIRVLSVHGYARTTTILVAAEADVSRGAMLHQFRTKADLMTFVVEAVYHREVSSYIEMLRGIKDPVERLLAYPEVAWKVLSQPSGVAVLEILQGSRSDKDLAAALGPIQTRIENDGFRMLSADSGATKSLELMRLIVWSARGLSIAQVLSSEPEQFVDAIRLLRTLIESAIVTGAITVERRVPPDKAPSPDRDRSRDGA